MPYVVNSQIATKERVEHNDFKGCDAIVEKFGSVDSLVTALATKAMENKTASCWQLPQPLRRHYMCQQE